MRAIVVTIVVVWITSNSWAVGNANLFAVTYAQAETLTAVCKEATGRAVGIEGNNKSVNESDALGRGKQITLVWERKTEAAQVVIQGADDDSPLLEKAVHVHSSLDSDTFLVRYPMAVWLYSVFYTPQRLLISQHTNGFFPNITKGAIAKAMIARCAISLK